MVLRQINFLRLNPVKILVSVGLLLLLLVGYQLNNRQTVAAEPTMTLHQQHVEQSELSCTDCHARNAQVQKENCGTCHDASEIEQRFQTFMTEIEGSEADQEEERDFPPFSHEKHPENVTCQQCHQDYKSLGRVPFEANLSMQICLDCHKTSDGPLECANCHGPGPISLPADHAQDWRRAHGAIAQVDLNKCAGCHQESFCQDCHEGHNITKNVHPLNWEQIHSFSAKGQEEDCLVCHQTRDECVNCHRLRNVMPHPLGSGWANTSDGGDHATAAGNLESCLDCHDLGSADPVCANPGCHQ